MLASMCNADVQTLQESSGKKMEDLTKQAMYISCSISLKDVFSFVPHSRFCELRCTALYLA